MKKRKVCVSFMKNIKTDPLQNTQGAHEDTTSPARKKKQPPKPHVKAVSKILVGLDWPLPPGPKTQHVGGESSNEDIVGDTPATSRQRGAKNYSPAELKLLVACVQTAVLISSDSFTEAAKLYNRIAAERDWAERGEKPLRQQWEKVKNKSHTCPTLPISDSLCSSEQ
jgi:hypothetical protein